MKLKNLTQHIIDHKILGIDKEIQKAKFMGPGGGVIDHSLLSNLDYASSGHTGFLQDTADVIKDNHIDWGTGANQVSAVDIQISDAGGYFTGTEVETALQEIGVSIGALPTNYLKLDCSNDPLTNQLEIRKNSAQLKLAYDATNYITLSTQSDGDLTLDSNKADYDIDLGDGNIWTTGDLVLDNDTGLIYFADDQGGQMGYSLAYDRLFVGGKNFMVFRDADNTQAQIKCIGTGGTALSYAAFQLEDYSTGKMWGHRFLTSDNGLYVSYYSAGWTNVMEWQTDGDVIMSVGDLVIDSDTKGVVFGDGQDSTIKWDNTNSCLSIDTETWIEPTLRVINSGVGNGNAALDVRGIGGAADNVAVLQLRDISGGTPGKIWTFKHLDAGNEFSYAYYTGTDWTYPFSMEPDGDCNFGAGSPGFGLVNDLGYRFGIQNDTAAKTIFGIKGVASQSGHYFLAENSSGTDLFWIASDGDLNLAGGVDIDLATSTGTKIGSATNQLLAFYGATPVNQPDTISDATTQDLTGTDTIDQTKLESDLSGIVTAITTIIDRLQELGLIA